MKTATRFCADRNELHTVDYLESHINYVHVWQCISISKELISGIEWIKEG